MILALGLKENSTMKYYLEEVHEYNGVEAWHARSSSRAEAELFRLGSNHDKI